MKQEETIKNLRSNSDRIKALTLTAMLFAAAMVLSVVESMIPLPVPVPGVKFGLSNIVVMYALFFQNPKRALAIAVLKAVFALLTRGAVAGLLSLSGGLCAVGIMTALMAVSKRKASYFILSMSGALFHNIGQFLAIMVIYQNEMLVYYLPMLLVGGVAAGMLTCVLLRFILPAFQKAGLK